MPEILGEQLGPCTQTNRFLRLIESVSHLFRVQECVRAHCVSCSKALVVLVCLRGLLSVVLNANNQMNRAQRTETIISWFLECKSVRPNRSVRGIHLHTLGRKRLTQQSWKTTSQSSSAISIEGKKLPVRNEPNMSWRQRVVHTWNVNKCLIIPLSFIACLMSPSKTFFLIFFHLPVKLLFHARRSKTERCYMCAGAR